MAENKIHLINFEHIDSISQNIDLGSSAPLNEKNLHIWPWYLMSRSQWPHFDMQNTAM